MQRLARAIVAFDFAVGIYHRVHRACAGAGDAFDVDAAVFDEFIHHAPAESAVRAAALQREVDALWPDMVGRDGFFVAGWFGLIVRFHCLAHCALVANYFVNQDAWRQSCCW